MVMSTVLNTLSFPVGMGVSLMNSDLISTRSTAPIGLYGDGYRVDLTLLRLIAKRRFGCRIQPQHVSGLGG